MRLLYLADGRSPIAQNWLRYFSEREHEVHLLSTTPCDPDLRVSSIDVIHVAFSRLGRGRTSPPGASTSSGSWLRTGLLPLRAWLRHWIGPWTVLPAASRVRAEIERIQPDLVHAMRIPFEGMLACEAGPSAPLLLSVWGNDFTLHADASPWMRSFTRRALSRADGLHSDCRRDQILAQAWGFSPEKPSVVLPGGGGVRREIFHPGSPDLGALQEHVRTAMAELPEAADVVVNPRGFRSYVRNDTFFKAIPEILREQPDTHFLCPAMAGNPSAQAWIRRLEIESAVHLLPRLTPLEMAAVYQRSEVVVSPSEHDGTPNSLLEALACGCFPVVGDIESLREWIEEGMNGLLVDPNDPQDLTDAILLALRDRGLRQRARSANLEAIENRADYPQVMAQADAFYQRLIAR
jgi:glycosyltransferase involved in cell wall biosynthesis